jgi:hypothetical protein
VRPQGYAVLTGPEGTVERDTYQCCHCQRIVPVRPGGGKTRGFCLMCNLPHCGGPACRACVPFERKLEEMENRSRFRKAMEA